MEIVVDWCSTKTQMFSREFHGRQLIYELLVYYAIERKSWLYIVIAVPCAAENVVEIQLEGYMYAGATANHIYGPVSSTNWCWQLCQSEYRYITVD